MILILNTEATNEHIKEVTTVYPGYTKVVIDVDQEILAAGGEYHIDCEQVLINNGSRRDSLWGGGYRFKSGEIDFIGLTNYKPYMNHFTYEVADLDVRTKMEIIIKRVFGDE